MYFLAPRKRKQKKRGDESSSHSRASSVENPGGRMSPFFQRKSFKRTESSSDEGDTDDGGRPGRLSPRSPLFTSIRKGRSRSKSPMRGKPASPTTPDGKRIQILVLILQLAYDVFLTTSIYVNSLQRKQS